MDDAKFRATTERIVSSIEATGMDPYEQLYGYLTTGNLRCITRTGNARVLIKTLNWKQLWDYVEAMRPSSNKEVSQ